MERLEQLGVLRSVAASQVGDAIFLKSCSAKNP
jgi:hypothetical protein